MYLEKNLASLAKRYPAYVNIIRSAPVSGRYVAQPSARKDGIPNLIDRKYGVAYYNNVDPYMSAEQAIRNQNIRLSNLAVFIGFGLGYHVMAYTQIFQGGIDQMIVFEKDIEVLKIALTSVDFGNLFEDWRLILCLGAEPVAYYPHLFSSLQMGNSKLYMQSMNFIESGPALQGDKDYYMAWVRSLKDAVSGVLNLSGNDPQDSLVGIQNTFYNIDIIIQNPGIKDLKGVFKNRPGVVVATGPSLNKNIDLLHEVNGKAVIVAADASLKVMQKHNLKPHFVTSLERVIATSKLFEGLTKEELKDIYLTACPVVRPETYANFPGEKIIVYRDFATFKWLNIDKGILEIGPSSANMAFKLLEFMGCNPIILIGQDLAFDGDTSHAEGTTYGAKQEHEWTRGSFMVEGNCVPEIRTHQVWNAFRKFYENDIAKFNGRVINATEGGAKIYGTEIMTFREAIDQHIKKPFDIIPVVNKKLNKPFAAQQEKDRQAVRKKVVDAIEYCDSVIKRLYEAVDICKDFKDNVYTPWKKGDYSKEEDAKKYFMKADGCLKIFSEEKFYLILMHYEQSYFIKSMIELNGIKATEDPSVELINKLMDKFTSMYGMLGMLTETMKKEFIALLDHLDGKEIEYAADLAGIKIEK